MSVILLRRFRQGAVMLFLCFLFLSPANAQPAHGVWNSTDTAWYGQGANTWRLRARTGLYVDSSGTYNRTNYYINDKILGMLEYLPTGYQTNPTQEYPLIIYFPGCGEIHDGKMFIHANGSPNYFYGLGRLFAQGGPPQPDIRYNATNEAKNTGAGSYRNGADAWWAESIDEYKNYLITPTTSTSFSTANAITGTTNTKIYQSGREGAAFSYDIPRDNGAYTLRLHFAELSLNAAGNTFNVTVEGSTVLTNFDIFADATGSNKALVKEYTINIGDGKLDLDFVATSGDVAKISAIEVISQSNGPGASFPAIPTLLRDRGNYFSAIPLKTTGQNYIPGGPTKGAIVLCLQQYGLPTICNVGSSIITNDDVEAAIRMAQRLYRIDYSRIYLTGMSAGGGVSYTYPGSTLTRARAFAAVAPVAAVNTIAGDNAAAQNIAAAGVSVLAVCNLYDFNTNGSGANTILANQNAIALLKSQTLLPGVQIGLHTFYKGSQVSGSWSPTNPEREHNAWENAYRMEFLDTFRAVYTDVTAPLPEKYTLYEWFMLQQRAQVFPVELTLFTARRINETALLNWTTASESNSSYFTIERSANGINFSDIGKVDAAGFSTTTRQYNFTDGNLPASPYVYYRLTQTDKDGKKQVFGIRKLYIGTNGFEVRVYPTITTGALTLEVQGVTSDPLTLRIVDLSGKLLKQQVIAPRQNRVNLDVSGLAKGMYIIHASNNVYQYTTKFVKQ